MKSVNRMAKSILIVLTAVFMSFNVPFSDVAWTQESDVAVSEQTLETLTIKGKVRKISFEENTLLVKPDKGKSVRIIFHEQTKLVDFDSFEEIEKKKPVKVWYTVEGEDNIAVKIERLPEVGC